MSPPHKASNVAKLDIYCSIW